MLGTATQGWAAPAGTGDLRSKVTGAEADGWMPSHAFLGLDRLGDAVGRINDAAADACRDPDQIRKIKTG